MSYSRRYTGSVHYSGSVTYHYPASETGGSGIVHYSGDVPVAFNVRVDTDPFDASVDKTKHSLTAVAGALSAAEAAQVAEIQKSGEKIASAATRGFFRVLGSELSSQISEFGSRMKSTVGLLSEQGNAIDGVHRQMEQDYNAIKGRYAKVFEELNRELDRRIRELDMPAFRLGLQTRREVLEAPYEQSAAAALVNARESQAAPMKLQCAHAKELANDALNNLGEACGLVVGYERSVEGVLDDHDGAGVEYIPVLYTLEEGIAKPGRRITVHEGVGMDNANVRSQTISFVSTRREEAWVAPTPHDRAQIDGSFAQLVEAYATAQDGAQDAAVRQRVGQLMNYLYHQGGTVTTYDNQN